MVKSAETILEEVTSTAVADKSEVTKQAIDEAIQIALEQARACEGTQECAVAWDIVEELQAAKSHRQASTKHKNSLDVYCNQHPEAVECLIYDV